MAARMIRAYSSKGFAAFGSQAANRQRILSLELFFHVNIVRFFQFGQMAGEVSLR